MPERDVSKPLSYTLIVLLAFALSCGRAAEPVNIENGEKGVSYLEPGDIIEYRPISHRRGFFESNLQIYCYSGVNKTFTHIFTSVELQLDIDNDDFTQYDGATPAEVRKHYEEHMSLFSITLFSQKRTRLPLSPFARKCIGIETTQTHRVRLQREIVDPWRCAVMLTGFLLFFYAGHLSHNAVFFYITGVIFGICSSLILVVWLSSKLIPRRPMMYGVLIGGSTIAIYVLQLLWANLQVIVLTYRTYVCWYILITGTVSFFACYRCGPPQNERSKNIIQWLLQLIALTFIYFSSYFEEAALTAVIATILITYFPQEIFAKLYKCYKKRFPPKRRLLTLEEYEEQGSEETAKALHELRNYVSSPECKQWRVMTKLRDPMRFAAFVEGASHVRDEEILTFERSRYSNTDDDDGEGNDYSGDENDDDDYQLQQQANVTSPVTRSNYSSRLQRQQFYSPPSVGVSTSTERFSQHEINDDSADDDDDDESAGYFHRDLSHHSNSVTTTTTTKRGTPTLNRPISTTKRISMNYAEASPSYSALGGTRRASERTPQMPTGRSGRMVQTARRTPTTQTHHSVAR